MVVMMMMKMVTGWEQMTLLTCTMAGDINRNKHVWTTLVLKCALWTRTQFCLFKCLYMCALCGGCNCVWHWDWIHSMHTDWEGHRTLRLHRRVTEISCHSIGNESPQRHGARSISVTLCRVTTEQAEHVRVSTHIRAGAGHCDKQHGKVTFPSDSQLAKRACQVFYHMCF